MYSCVYVYMCISVCVCVYICVYVCVCVCICVCVCVYVCAFSFPHRSSGYNTAITLSGETRSSIVRLFIPTIRGKEDLNYVII